MDLSELISVDDVSKFLVENGIPQEFVVVLKDNYIDGLEFRELEYQDLLVMLPGKLGIVKKIWRLVKHYHDQFGIGNSSTKRENVIDDTIQVPNIPHNNLITASLSPARDIVSTSKVNVASPMRNECIDKEVSGKFSPASSENIPKPPVSESSSIDVAETDHQSSLLGESKHKSKEPSIPSLPTFSSRIRSALKLNKVSQVYDSFVSEAAYDLISKGDIVNDKRLYEQYSKKMFYKYPCIGMPGGRKEWSCFSKKLSGKLRNIRWRHQKYEKETSFLKRRKGLRKIAPRAKKLNLDYLMNENELGEQSFEENSANWLEDVVYVPIKQEVQDGEEFAFGKGELDVTLTEMDDKLDDANNDSQKTELTEFMKKVMAQSIEDCSSGDFQKIEPLHAHEAISLPPECNKISVTFGDLTRRVVVNRECIKSTIEIIKKKFQFHSMDKIRIEGKIDDVEDYIALNHEDEEDIQELKKCTKLRIKRIQEAETCASHLVNAGSISSVSQQRDVDSCSTRTTGEGHNFSKKETCYIQDQQRTISKKVLPLDKCNKASLELDVGLMQSPHGDNKLVLPTDVFKKILDYCNNAPIEDKQTILDLMRKIRYNRWHWLKSKKPNLYKVLQVFPRFVDVSEMINIDFTEKYGQKKSNQLLNKWESIISPAILKLARQIKSSSALSTLLEELPSDPTKEMVSMFAFIGSVIILLSRSTRTNQRSFSTSAPNLFIQFQKSNLNLRKFVSSKTQTQPFLLCLGSIYKPEQMAIIAGNAAIPCPNDVISAVDKLFKCHFCFNTEYASPLNSFYQFLEYYVYEMNQPQLHAVERKLAPNVMEFISSLDAVIPKKSFNN